MFETVANSIEWQNLTTLAIVFTALAGLARRAYGLFASQALKGCGSACSGCPASGTSAPALVRLDLGRSATSRR